jgi:hypothetical protein
MEPKDRSRPPRNRIAERLLEAKSGGLNPSEWAELAQQAATVREEVVKEI